MSSTGTTPAPDPNPSVTRVAPAPTDPWIGRKLKKYALVARLGQGGMGVVYLAEDTILQRVVAVKMIAGAHVGDPLGARRFLREARAAAKLQHANVASIYDIDEDAGTHFIVMEFVPGPTAQQIIDQAGALPWRSATQIALDGCRGLVAAHAAKLIHRDIKPANIMVSRTGEVKLSDFGLAKTVAEKQTALTLGDQVLGTPHYMSPEQGQNSGLDERSDLYSLGATYYAMLTGEPPYPGKDALGTIYAHTTLPIPDPRAKAPAVPEACSTIVRRAMAKRRADRYADATAMLADLEAALGPTRESLSGLAVKFDVPQVPDTLSQTLDLRRIKSRIPRVALLLACAIGVLAVLGIAAFALTAVGHWLGGSPESPERLKRDLMACNPGFNGEFKAAQRDGRIVRLSMNVDSIVNLDPIGELTHLEELELSGTKHDSSQLTDITPLARLQKLKRLQLTACPIENIEALKDLRALQVLDLSSTKVTHLHALSNLRLTSLRMGGSYVADLRGLENVPIEKLYVGFVYRLKSLEGAPVKTLKWISLESTAAESLEPLKGASRLEYLNYKWAKLTSDQRPPKGQPATHSLRPRDFEVLLALPNLEAVVGEFTADEEARLLDKRKSLRILRTTPDENF